MPTILIYDEIGPDAWGLVSAKSILQQLDAADQQPVEVRINSPGGDVLEAQAIYNALLRHPAPVTVHIDALAASAASYVAMAGQRIEIAANAMLMVHNPWTIAAGDAEELRKTAEVLDKLRLQFGQTYAARSKLELADVLEMMDEETWLTAEEAVQHGLADDIGQTLNVSAAIVPPGRFRHAPPQMIAHQPPPQAAQRLALRKARLELVRQQLALQGVRF